MNRYNWFDRLIIRLFKLSLPVHKETLTEQGKTLKVQEGEIYIDKEFGESWVKIEVVKVGESGKNCLIKFHVANGANIVNSSIYNWSVRIILSDYKKLENV
jgi:hypothetical protein